MTRTAWCLAAVIVAICAAASLVGGAQPAPPLPPELRGAPADPAPGRFLPIERARSVFLTLEALEVGAAFGVGRSEADGKRVAFRLLPYTGFRRFGEPGAAPEEFRAGDRVRVRLVSAGAGRPAPYALEIADGISLLVEQRRAYRMLRQESADYRFVLEPVDAEGNAEPGPVTLEYGRGTFLVLREDPVYIFRIPAGTRLWINTAAPAGDGPPLAREVLDEPSLRRFQGQTRLRMIARCDAAGAPAYLSTAGTGLARAALFPDVTAWVERLRPGDRLRVTAAALERVASVRTVETPPGGARLLLELDARGFRPDRPVRLAPVRDGVNYARDILPILEVNCLSCHRDGNAQSGYSLSTPERLRAGGRRGPGVVPGRSAESWLYLTASGDRNPRMPPDRDLIPEQLDLIRRWIDAGAPMEPRGTSP